MARAGALPGLQQSGVETSASFGWMCERVHPSRDSEGHEGHGEHLLFLSDPLRTVPFWIFIMLRRHFEL
jgi:hypothetical protein